MKTWIAVFGLLVLTALPALAQQEIWTVQEKIDSEAVSIDRVHYVLPTPRPLEPGEFATLDEAIDSIDSIEEGVRIEYIRLDPIPKAQAERFQRELYAYYQQHHPAELKAGEASSGNLHNPKVKPLATAYRQAVLHTSYIAEIQERLKPKNHKIAKVSFEKFFLSKSNDQTHFIAITWLALEKEPPPKPTLPSSVVQ